MNEMHMENWQGHVIRFVSIDGEWYAILKDICDALGLYTFKVSQRLNPDMLIRVPITTSRTRPKHYNKSTDENYDIPSKYIVKSEDSTVCDKENYDIPSNGGRKIGRFSEQLEHRLYACCQ